MLVGRTPGRLERVAAHLRALGATAEPRLCSGTAEIEPLWDEVWNKEPVDQILVAQGFLPGDTGKSGTREIQETFEANTVAPIVWCQAAARSMEARGQGTIAVLGSVAGDRGRYKNHIYSGAKRAVETYCEGLSLKVGPKIKVCLIKPGITESGMTADMPRGILMFSAETVARCAAEAMEKGKLKSYAPPIWKWAMLVIRLLPRWVLRKTKM